MLATFYIGYILLIILIAMSWRKIEILKEKVSFLEKEYWKQENRKWGGDK